LKASHGGFCKNVRENANLTQLGFFQRQSETFQNRHLLAGLFGDYIIRCSKFYTTTNVPNEAVFHIFNSLT